jgi:predicted nucleic acid-binding protein
LRKQFAEHFPLSEEERRGIWAEGIFVFDTNVLLNLYRMRRETSSKIRDILRKLKGRLFLPHQVGKEFFRHREDEIADQVNTFEKVKSYLTKIPDRFKQEFPRHPCIPISDIAEALAVATEKQVAAVAESQQANELNFLVPADDPILRELEEIFRDCTDDQTPTQEDEETLGKKVEERFQRNLPPCQVFAGGKAVPAPATNPHIGDGRIWFEILKRAAKVKKPFVFVTADERANFWRTARLGNRDRIIGPHFQLVRDVESVSGELFVMYTQETFLADAPKYLGVPDQSQAIQEAKQIRESVDAEKESGQAGLPAAARWVRNSEGPDRPKDAREKDACESDSEKSIREDDPDKAPEAESKGR